MTPKRKKVRPVLGWREWVGLPQLGIPALKAKVDTGALTSSLHAFDLEPFERDGEAMIRFKVNPHQRSRKVVVATEAPLVDEREVRTSSGHQNLRPVIETVLVVGEDEWPIEVTLTRRDQLGFRMLLGRRALRRRVLVDPGRSFLRGRRPKESS